MVEPEPERGLGVVVVITEKIFLCTGAAWNARMTIAMVTSAPPSPKMSRPSMDRPASGTAPWPVRCVSVVSRRTTTETQNSPSMQSVSENPQLIPVESSSMASGS